MILSLIKSKKTYFFLLLLCSVGIALQLDFYKITIFALLLHSIITLKFRETIIKLSTNKLSVGMIFLYVFYAVSLLWSENIEFALTDLVLKTPILILPLVFLIEDSLTKKQINQILLSFALSILFLNLFCLANSYANYINTGKVNEFFYRNFTINMHTAYQAMFTSFSIVIFIYLRIKEKFILNWIMLGVVFLQMIFLLLLSSRMQILITAALIPLFLIPRYYKKKKLFLGLSYVVLIFFSLKLIMNIPSSLNYRYNQTVSHINSIGMKSNNADPRKFIWEEAFQVIKNNWLTGVGVGDVKDVLQEKYLALQLGDSALLANRLSDKINDDEKIILYLKEKAQINNIEYEEQFNLYVKSSLERKKNRYKMAAIRGYNFHNQYLQITASIGVFGLFLFLVILGAPFFIALHNKDYLFLSFLFIIGLSFLTESMLERQAGVVFIAFFYSFFLAIVKNQSK